MFDIANNADFIKALGIADADEETKSTLIAGLEDLAQQKLITKISDILTDQQAEEFGQIADEKQAYDWLTTNIPNFTDMATEVLAEIRDDILTRKVEIVG